MHTGEEKEISAYPTPDELWAMTFAEVNAWRDRFAAVPLDTPGGKHAYYYQETAIERVLKAIAAGKDRILLTLATGTGKTFIAFQSAWKLFQARWNLSGEPTRRPRILFLADRNILADQAYNAFSAFAEDALVRIEPGEIKKKGKVPKNGSVFFTIFQTFLSGPSESAHFGEYPPDFFDFIVIDECHRGGANDESTWHELRALWSDPLTRKKLLEGLEEKGFGKSQLHEMQTIIDAEKSDLFDVLAHVAYALPTLSREERAAKAKVEISTHFNSKQQVFLDFVLSHYVSVGVEELDQDKLTPLLKLKYHDSIQDAVADLGSDVGKAFAGFQKYLYQDVA